MLRHQCDGEVSMALLEVQNAPELNAIQSQSDLTDRSWVVGSVEDTAQYIQERLNQYAARKGAYFGMWFQDKIAGVCSLEYIDWVNHVTEVGVWIADQYQCKGLYGRAGKHLIEYVFEDLKLNKANLYVQENNSRMRELLEETLFTTEGVCRSWKYFNGQYHDYVLYGMLSSEWPKIKELTASKNAQRRER